MSLFKDMVSNGIRKGIGDGIAKGISKAVGEAVNKAVTPAAERYADKAAGQINEVTASMGEANNTNNTEAPASSSADGFSALSGAFANLSRASEQYATQMSKDIKVCPSCGEPTRNKGFCPNCGAKLPEMTLADGALCPNCGKQNTIGTRFCDGCGAKLPSAIAEDEASAQKDAVVLAKWDEILSNFPRWNCGGKDYKITQFDDSFLFCATFNNNAEAVEAIDNYRNDVKEAGFVMAGEFPEICNLYAMIDGVCHCVDTAHLFEGDDNVVDIYFYCGEPSGGFYYKKPEKKETPDIFKLFKF